MNCYGYVPEDFFLRASLIDPIHRIFRRLDPIDDNSDVTEVPVRDLRITLFGKNVVSNKNCGKAGVN
jgi:hypothetical protein